MRLVIDALIAVMAAALLLGVLFMHEQKTASAAQLTETKRELARIAEVIRFHAAMDTTEDGAVNWPHDVTASWFGQPVPTNRFAGAERAWLDVAPDGDSSDQPPDPLLQRPGQAGFWYNPNNGIIRARVPATGGEQAALELYNQLNGTGLSFFKQSSNPARRPIPQMIDVPPQPKKTAADSANNNHNDPQLPTPGSPEPQQANPDHPKPRRPSLINKP